MFCFGVCKSPAFLFRFRSRFFPVEFPDNFLKEKLGPDTNSFSFSGSGPESSVGAYDQKAFRRGVIKYFLFDDGVSVGVSTGKIHFEVAESAQIAFVRRSESVENDVSVTSDAF